MYSANHLTPDMLEPITMINKLVDLLDKLNHMYT